MNSWLAGGLKTSLSSLKDQVANSIKDVLEEFEEDNTDNDLLDEESGRDAGTRLLLAVDRLRDVRQSFDDQKKQLDLLKEKNESLRLQNEQKDREQNQFKDLLRDKEEEIEYLSRQVAAPDDQFRELNKLLNDEKVKNIALQSSSHPDLVKIADLEEKLNLCEEKSATLQANNTELCQKVQQLEEKLKVSEKIVATGQEQFQVKLQQLNDVNSENSALKAKLSELEEEVSQVCKQLGETQALSDNGQNDHVGVIEELRSDKILLENECSELKEKVASLIADLALFKEIDYAINLLMEDLSRLTNERNQLKKKNKELEGSNEQLSSAIANFENQLKSCQAPSSQEESSKELVSIKEESAKLKNYFSLFSEVLERAALLFNQEENYESLELKGKVEFLVGYCTKLQLEKEREVKALKDKLVASENEKNECHLKVTDLIRASEESENDRTNLKRELISLENKLKEVNHSSETLCSDQTFSALLTVVDNLWQSFDEAANPGSLGSETDVVERGHKLLKLVSELQIKSRNGEINEGHSIEEKRIKAENEILLSENCELKEKLKESNESHEKIVLKLKSEIDETATSFESEIAHLRESIEDLESKNSVQSEEILQMDKLISCLRDKNELLVHHNEANAQVADEFKEQVVLMQANLGYLEESLKLQTNHNDELQKKLAHALEAKASVDDILAEFGRKSAEHEENLTGLQAKLESLKEAESKANEYREVLDKQQHELDELKAKLQSKDESFNEMKSETDVYKLQYEGLLEEYQQYLQDLEVLQSKSENLEKWKTAYEEQITDLKEQAEKQEKALDAAKEKIEEFERRDQERLELVQKVSDLEMALSREKTTSRELKDVISDKDMIIKDFHTVNMKEILADEEKEQDESDSRVEELQEHLERVKSEREALEAKLILIEKDHREEMSKYVSELEDIERLKRVNEEQEATLKQKDTEKNNIIGVLQEKTRESNHLKAENSRLLQSIADMKERQDKDSMSQEAIQKLSTFIRDKDLEIESLKHRNQSLVDLIQNSDAKLSQSAITEKSVMDNSNEIVILKSKIGELEKKLSLAQVKVEMQDASLAFNRQSRRRYHSTSETFEGQEEELKLLLEQLTKEKEAILKEKLDQGNVIASHAEELRNLKEELRNLKRKSDSLEHHLAASEKQLQDTKMELEQSQDEMKAKAQYVSELNSVTDRLKVELEEKKHDLAMAQRNLDQLKEMLEEKSSTSENHQQERMLNIAAIQELQSNITKLMRERDESQLSVNDKDRQLTELRHEVNNVIDKKKKLEHELVRLKQHLVVVEEGYTQEALEAEERERELRKKIQVTEEALRLSSTQQSNTNRVASVHLQKLETQVSDLTRERDQLTEKMGRISHEYTLQSKAMANLNQALESFQAQKDNEIKWAEKDFHDRILEEKKKQDELKDEIDELKQKVANANEGLAAASRLSEQLEKKTHAVAMLKHEVKLRDDLLRKAQNELKEANANTTVKVDKYLVKNLVVGYVNADASKKKEVLKIIATVLDFNQDEREQTGLDAQQSSGWLSSFFSSPTHPQHRRTSSAEVHEATGLDLSLAQAFVAFLQTESTPKTPMLLPQRSLESTLPNSQQSNTPSSGRSTPSSVMPTLGVVNPGFSASNNERSASGSPLLFAATSSGPATLPTFSVGRSSSSILRQVLQEEGDTSNQ